MLIFKKNESCIDYQVTKSVKEAAVVSFVCACWSLSLSLFSSLALSLPMSISLALSPLSIFFPLFSSCLSLVPLSAQCPVLFTNIPLPQKQNRGTLEQKRSHAAKRPRAWCQHFWKDRWNWWKVLIAAGFLLDLYLCVYMTDSIHNLLRHSSSCVLICLCRPLLCVCSSAWSTSQTKDDNCNRMFSMRTAVRARTNKHKYNAHTCICVHVGTHTRMNVNSSM